MNDPERRFRVEAYGVRFGIIMDDPGLAPAIPSTFPPGCRPIDDVGEGTWFSLERTGTGYVLTGGSEGAQHLSSRAEALQLLENTLVIELAEHMRDLVAVHAGVVGWRGRAIVLPADSMAGKSTMTHALISAGADYFSDELALFDGAGLVHSYPRRIALRRPGGREYVRVAKAATAPTALPLGLVLITRYLPGASWTPCAVTAGTGLLALLRHAIRLRMHPERTVRYLTQAMRGASALKGDRGEALETARAVLAYIDARAGFVKT